MSIALLSATSPEELVSFKKVLEAKGIPCEIKQEDIQVHQYYSSPGAKLYIADFHVYDAQNILSKYGSNQADAAMNIGLEHSTEELKLKGVIRQIGNIEEVERLQLEYRAKGLTQNEVADIFTQEKKYIIHRQENKFDLNDFLTALFEGGFFKYLNRNKSVKYEVENELIAQLDDDEE